MSSAQTPFILWASLASTTVMLPAIALVAVPAPPAPPPPAFAVALLFAALAVSGVSVALPRVLGGRLAPGPAPMMLLLRCALAEMAVIMGFAGRTMGLPLWHLLATAALGGVAMLLAMPGLPGGSDRRPAA